MKFSVFFLVALVIILAFSEDCDGRSYPKRKKSDPNLESKTASPANKRKPREVDLESAENQAIDSFMWGRHGGRGRRGGYGGRYGGGFRRCSSYDIWGRCRDRFYRYKRQSSTSLDDSEFIEVDDDEIVDPPPPPPPPQPAKPIAPVSPAVRPAPPLAKGENLIFPPLVRVVSTTKRPWWKLGKADKDAGSETKPPPFWEKWMKKDKDKEPSKVSNATREGHPHNGNLAQHKRSKRRIKIKTVNVRLWPDGLIPFMISRDYNDEETKVITTALQKIEDVSCVKFAQHFFNGTADETNPKEYNYIKIWKGHSCSSDIGMQGGRQVLFLNGGCMDVGSVIHEFMHAMGLPHEMSRPDRDKFIVFNKNNIKPRELHNFEKTIYKNGRYDHTKMRFDPRSRMIYDPSDFSLNTDIPTFYLKHPFSLKHKLGPRDLFTKLDIKKMNLLYPCRRM